MDISLDKSLTLDRVMIRQNSRLHKQLWLFATLRAFIIFFAALLLLLSFHYGSAYLTSQHAIETVDDWFEQGTIPPQADVVEALTALQHADEILTADAHIKISIAKLYILLSQLHNTGSYLNTAYNIVQRTRILQPTHFEADSLLVLLDDRQQVAKSRFEKHLREALRSGGLEQSSQLILGPIVVSRWTTLPEDIQQLAGPMIRSMLSEEDVREVLFKAMNAANLYRPFAKFSPNRKTSALLRELEKEKG